MNTIFSILIDYMRYSYQLQVLNNLLLYFRTTSVYTVPDIYVARAIYQ